MQETGGALKSWEEHGDEVDARAHYSLLNFGSLLACMQEYVTYNVRICILTSFIWLVTSQPPLVAKTAGITQ